MIQSHLALRAIYSSEHENDHWTIAKSLSELRLLLFALCPGRKNSIFLFLASLFFLCFFIFFLAAMSGLATAWETKKKRNQPCWHSRNVLYIWTITQSNRFPEKLTCMALCFFREARLCEDSFCTAEKASENFSRPTSFFSKSMSSWDRFFNVGSDIITPDHDVKPTATDRRHRKCEKLHIPWSAYVLSSSL